MVLLGDDLNTIDDEINIATERIRTIIKDRREELNLSQVQLSKRSGIPQKTIWRIENGVDVPKIPTIIRLLHTMDLNLFWLVAERDK